MMEKEWNNIISIYVNIIILNILRTVKLHIWSSLSEGVTLQTTLERRNLWTRVLVLFN